MSKVKIKVNKNGKVKEFSIDGQNFINQVTSVKLDIEADEAPRLTIEMQCFDMDIEFKAETEIRKWYI